MKNVKATKIIFVFILILTGFIVFPAMTLYAQDSEIKIAVIPFENNSGLEEYDYLSRSMQSSIYSNLSNIENITVISNTTASNIATEVGLNSENVDKITISLRFAVKAEINIIILGSFTIDKDTGEMSVNTTVYSIAQKERIINSTADLNVNEGVIDIIDKLAFDTTVMIEEKRESMLIALEEIQKDISPPEYIKKPTITDISPDGVKVEWETNKETVSVLYIGTEEDFEVTDDTMTFTDESDNAVNHFVFLDYEEIDPESKYYYKTEDQDFFDNKVETEEKTIEKNEIKGTLIKKYEEEMDTLSKELDNAIKNNDFEKSKEVYHKILDKNNEYGNVIETEGAESEEMEKVVNDFEHAEYVMSIINEADKLQKERKFADSLSKYEEALEKLGERDIESLIPKSDVNNEINRMKSAIEVEKMISEADKMVAPEEVEKEVALEAVQIYENSIEKIKNDKIEDLFPIQDIETKIETAMPIYYAKPVNFGVSAGLFMNMNNENVLYLTQTTFTYRFGNFFSIGAGVNFNSLAVTLFMNFSFINVEKFEFFIRGGGLLQLLPSEAFGYGFIWSLDAAYRFNETISVYLETGAWIAFYTMTDYALIYPYITLGAGFSF